MENNQTSSSQAGPSTPLDQSASSNTPDQPVAPQTVINPTPQAPTAPTVGAPVAPGAFGMGVPPSAPTPPEADAPAQPAAPVMPDAPVSPFAGSTMPVAKKSRLPLIGAAVAGIVVLAVGGYFAMNVLLGSVSKADVSTARDAANSLIDNMMSAGSAAGASMTTSTSEALQSKVTLAKAKLNAAEKQYDVLKKSHVQRNSKVHEKFMAFDKKWGPYKQYLQANLKDMEALQPLVISMEGDLKNSLKTTPTTTAELGAYLTTFKSVIDGTSDKAGKITMTVEENKQLLKAMQDFLDAASTAIAAAQADLAAGKSYYVVSDHMYDLSSAYYDFTDKVYSIQSQIDDKANMLDPSDQFNDFQSALTQLYMDLTK